MPRVALLSPAGKWKFLLTAHPESSSSTNSITWYICGQSFYGARPILRRRLVQKFWRYWPFLSASVHDLRKLKSTKLKINTAYCEFYFVTKRENTARFLKHFETHPTDIQQSVGVLKAINGFLIVIINCVSDRQKTISGLFSELLTREINLTYLVGTITCRASMSNIKTTEQN
jgi:hypothetical protein